MQNLLEVPALAVHDITAAILSGLSISDEQGDHLASGFFQKVAKQHDDYMTSRHADVTRFEVLLANTHCKNEKESMNLSLYIFLIT